MTRRSAPLPAARSRVVGRERPRPRGAAAAARRPLTVERIHREALALIDAGGVESLSMRRLAAQLGVDPMSIYHHVPDKRALLQGVYQRVLEELPIPDGGASSWQQALRELARRFHALAGRHPKVMPALLSSPFGTVREHDIHGGIDRILDQVGFDHDDRVRMARAIYTYASGLVAVVASGFGLRPIDAGREASVAPEHRPRPTLPSAADIEFSIDLLIAGIEALARTRGLPVDDRPSPAPPDPPRPA